MAAHEGVDLSGAWRATPGDDELRRAFADPGFDDDGWTDVQVPGHWRSVPGFESCDGPVLHRTTFEAPAPEAGRRSWLTFDGVFYQGDVWLDGSYVGDTEGYFFPHSFEITDALKDRSEHVLAVEVACAPQRDKKAKRNLTGVFQHWDCFDPDWNPGGIWRPVGLRETGPVRIASLRARCVDATTERATLRLSAHLDAATAGAVELRTTIASTDHAGEHRLAAGSNIVTWEVRVDQPDLWWPWALGEQRLVDVSVTVTPLDGATSDVTTRLTGLRQVRMRKWVLEVNGERLFAKGANQGPTRMALAEATAADLERDVVLAKEAGLDLLRVHAHISRPELYDAADRHGVLLWQDLPLQWGYARGLRGQAVKQARAAVDLLAHHPSVAVWCAHNEPLALDLEPGNSDVVAKQAVAFARGMALPTWNKTVLDTSLARALEKSDGSRPVIKHSGVLPHPAWGTDSHLYFGWYHGEERDLPAALRRLPVLARFVTEFGAQAVPDTDDFLQPERWPDLDWERLGRAHALQKSVFDRHVPPADHETFQSWRDATQTYQAELLRHHVEHLRRLKYRPTGGFAMFSFADGHPGVTWSVLDHDRVPKAGYHALAAACAPVIITADRPDATYAPGAAVALDVHVVSDLRIPLDRCTVRAVLSWDGGDHRWGWQGDVPADSCERIGTMSFVAPEVEGPVTLTLTLESARAKAENTYTTVIARP